MNESYEDYRDKGCYGREPGQPKFKEGDKVLAGDFHFSHRCVVVEYVKGGKYRVRKASGDIITVPTKLLRADVN